MYFPLCFHLSITHTHIQKMSSELISHTQRYGAHIHVRCTYTGSFDSKATLLIECAYLPFESFNLMLWFPFCHFTIFTFSLLFLFYIFAKMRSETTKPANFPFFYRRFFLLLLLLSFFLHLFIWFICDFLSTRNVLVSKDKCPLWMRFYCDCVVLLGIKQKKSILQMFYLVEFRVSAKKKRIQFIDIGPHNAQPMQTKQKISRQEQQQQKFKTMQITYKCMHVRDTTLFLFHFTLNLNWMQCASDVLFTVRPSKEVFGIFFSQKKKIK